MRSIIAIAALLALAGCATGSNYRTTITEGNKTTTYEARQTGLWFADREPKPLTAPKDRLDFN